MCHDSLVALLQDSLLAVMDRKHHWAYPALTRPGLTRDQLFAHFRHEYLVYVRDFPVLLARALGIAPAIDEVRRSLAENLYEEQTGGLSGTAPHPRLFLRMMEGLGFDARAFVDDDGWLHPAAVRYRDFLRERASRAPWQAAVALLTIFVEGSVNERGELAGTFVRRSGEDAVRDHPLVVHYGCPSEAMELTRAHARVEGEHRKDAWRLVLAHANESEPIRAVVGTCEQALALWHDYRDGVAAGMGLQSKAAPIPAPDRSRTA
jgi:pyrroloquinoline quinone (PQQ) biosynthesis protein C